MAAIMWWRLDAVVECLCARRESGISPRAAWQQSNIWREREREGWRKGGVDRGEGEIRDRGKQEAMVTGRDRGRRRGADKNVEPHTCASGFVAMLC